MTAFPNIMTPHLGTTDTTLDNSLKSETDSGITITRKKYSRQLHRYGLKWAGMSYADLVTLKEFYSTMNGGAASFTWTDDLNVTRTVRFDSNLEAEPRTNDRWDVSVSLIEV